MGSAFGSFLEAKIPFSSHELERSGPSFATSSSASRGRDLGRGRRWSLQSSASGEAGSAAEAISIFAEYEIDGMLGSGTFGQVRACRMYNDPKRRCAVKIVDTQGEVFRQASCLVSAYEEARILQLVDHQHIVHLVDVYEQEHWLFIIMERIEGGELFSAIGDPRSLVTDHSIGIVGRQLMEALKHLHGRHITHRDVKAENILLAEDPAKSETWHIKLIDFGLSVHQEPKNCFVGISSCSGEAPTDELICGTAYYCAPEVWRNVYGPKVDVYAAGVVLYLALFGCFPFYNGDVTTLEALICDMTAQPSYSCPLKAFECYEVSRASRACLERLLQKDPSARPTSAMVLGGSFPWLGNLRPSQHGGEPVRPIPMPIRKKAARAGARAPVDVAQEVARSKALEVLKARANLVMPRKYTNGGAEAPSFFSVTTRASERDDRVPSLADGFDMATVACHSMVDTDHSDSEVEGPPLCTCTRIGRSRRFEIFP